MNINQYPHTAIADKDGNLTPEWQLFFEQLVNALQTNLSSEGYKVPHQTTANINLLNTEKSIGAILYDRTTNKLKVNIYDPDEEKATFRTVTTS